jgi:hypothetical protein
MEAALANAGEVAASLPLPLYADEAVGRFVPLCLAKVKTPALPKLKMVKDLDHEVRQYWVHSDTEEDPAEIEGTPKPSSTSSKRIGTSGRQGVSTGGVDPAVGFEKLVPATTSSMRGGGTDGGIGARRRPVGSGPRLHKGIKPEYARPLCHHIFHHDLWAFSLDEECKSLSYSNLLTCLPNSCRSKMHYIPLVLLMFASIRSLCILICSNYPAIASHSCTSICAQVVC